MENIKNKKWYDNVLWICIISYAIHFISETIGGLFISRLVKGLFTSGLIRGDVYIYTFIMYILFIDIWIGVLFVLFVFKSMIDYERFPIESFSSY